MKKSVVFSFVAMARTTPSFRARVGTIVASHAESDEHRCQKNETARHDPNTEHVSIPKESMKWIPRRGPDPYGGIRGLLRRRIVAW